MLDKNIPLCTIQALLVHPFNNMTESKREEKKKDRSTAYPAISLEQALEYSKKLVEAYRKNPFSRQNAVEGIGYKKITGDTAQKIGALGHYGLLEKSGKSAYQNSEIAQSICYFTDDDSRLYDIQKVVQTPKLFRALIERHAGQSLPARLNSVLVQSHGITPTVADKVAVIFEDSLNYAGLLVNGVVQMPKNDDSEEDSFESEEKSGDQESKGSTALTQKKQAPKQVSMDMLPLELPSGIIIYYPERMAYKFATGAFGKEIAALNDIVTAEYPSVQPNNSDDDGAVSPTE